MTLFIIQTTIAAALAALVISSLIAEYKEADRVEKRQVREIQRVTTARETAADAVEFRAQLDREQLWRDLMADKI